MCSDFALKIFVIAMATTKYLLNDRVDAVSDMLQGLSVYDNNLLLCSQRKVVLRRQVQPDQVHVISGGGSGHEPFAAGYVGDGMLSAAIAGEIFTSPPPANIEAAVDALCRASREGVLAIVANYTGDVLNFGIACERARTRGHRVESLVVGEDCASLELGRTSLAGRRGMCGIVLVIKIAGAMAAHGLDLNTIAQECEQVAQNITTLGVCLEPCSIPGSGPMFSLEPDQIDIGLGIHGEAGIFREKMSTAKQIVGVLLDKICHHLKLNLTEKSAVCVLVNNLGTLTQLELGVIHKEIHTYFNSTRITIKRLYSAPTMTSLDMKGFQLCVLKLANEHWLQWLDAETAATGWPKAPIQQPVTQDLQPSIEPDKGFSFEDIKKIPGWDRVTLKTEDKELVLRCMRNAADAIGEKAPELNELDQICGDGDCGSTLSRLADGVSTLQAVDQYVGYPVAICKFLEHWAETQMGGTSGALYSLFFLSAGAYCAGGNGLDWDAVFIAGVDGILKYSKARKGDRTMLDVLIECKEYLRTPAMLDKSGKFVASEDNLNKLEGNLRRACEETSTMVPRAGRASNVNANLINRKDAGAYGAYIWISAIINTLKSNT